MADPGSVNRNLLASFLGNAWTAIVQIAFVPAYIHFLGIEAYGLIGFHALLLAALAILDMGLTPTVSREASRFRAGTQGALEIRALLRSIEVVLLAVALLVIGLAWALAPWIAVSWLNVEALPREATVNAIGLMGVLVAMRLAASPYRGAIGGSQQLVWLSTAGAAFATLRGAGVVAVLAWVSPTLGAFFLFQCMVTAIEVAVLSRMAWSLLPAPVAPPLFSAAAVGRIWRFSGGLTIASVLYLVLAQIDKVMLSAMLPLSEFACYALASSIAGALIMLVAPIGSVAYPRLNELAAVNDPAAFTEAFHRFSQLATIAVAPAALVLALFAEPILFLWTRDAVLSRVTAPLLALLAGAAMLAAFMVVPYMVPLTSGRTRTLILLNATFLALFAPAIYFGVTAIGAIASGYAWLGINALAVVLGPWLLDRHLTVPAGWRWFMFDVGAPASAALAAVLLVWLIGGNAAGEGGGTGAFVVLAAFVLASAAAVAASAIGRQWLATCWKE